MSSSVAYQDEVELYSHAELLGGVGLVESHQSEAVVLVAEAFSLLFDRQTFEEVRRSDFRENEK
jgi:hypothetical protein